MSRTAQQPEEEVNVPPRFVIKVEVCASKLAMQSVSTLVRDKFVEVMLNGDELDTDIHLGVLLIEDESDLVEVEVREPRGEPPLTRVVITQNDPIRDHWIVGRTGMAENPLELRLASEIAKAMAWHYDQIWGAGQVRFANNFQRSRAGDPTRRETTKVWKPAEVSDQAPDAGVLSMPKNLRGRTFLTDTSHLRV
ncbi:MAG: hypothetical protein UU40_C0001G0065 [Candidatus Uhrbacteria bacterium GW2011_GWD2_41_121]|uniref:Uncharacterized protein n=1 Tax=Candidatus Uhrbacteria bacterium GW2011_GWC1_41_20 TaxID=1618983 RepID=A0A0G0YHX2_9BACT|nr:MAG: hypothetical protein UT52_C0001G0005 [Candidatus Uhrbacteria bacterium GW2011_GWE1_39_46]KKR64394.1 MAG: hypothetical protein UU04_C0002G0005 [Candidatus Uhrbacteria bacterium GW2011_GWC2_40_450]KKR89844.1 MAG: hypothetical protein UU36_C0016G0007 [Candidatus Uhrbacteria bacterium GW2011_GWE2_41_1153]KKR90727.1 MAG: hypothetical protein UU40_C0001G0065 [Candidatus Uhrbacteria bacterium GW2011_GWD2_41_121]KKR96556.1 MAG: hypothetical protein UU46_C0001G0005 [Candidatus Uhrbacteria bacter